MPTTLEDVACVDCEGIKVDRTGARIRIEGRHRSLDTLDKVLKYARVNMSEWDVERCVINPWEGFIKVGYGDKARIKKTTLFQVKVFLKHKGASLILRRMFDDVVKKLKEISPTTPVKHAGGDHMLEVSIADLHLGKLCWPAETGNDYTSHIATRLMRDAVPALVGMAKGFSIGKIILPIGNDFFNVDSDQKLTTAGTVQDEDGRWQKTFIQGRVASLQAINWLRTIAPVHIVMVQGNHDSQRLFYLGEALEGWLHKTPGVTIDNAPTPRKRVLYGNSLVMFTHGSEESIPSLPLILADQWPDDWSKSRFREIHIGHVHKKKEMYHTLTDEFRGVRVRAIPSLTATDSWHNKKGYSHLRAAEAFVYSKTGGCLATLSWSPKL